MEPPSQNQPSKTKKRPKKKTKPACRQFQDSGTCSYGDSCRFAHHDPPPPDASAEIFHEPIDDFFAQYPRFRYRRNAHFWDEFYRMCGQFKGTWDGADRDSAKAGFRVAMVEQFNSAFGTDENDLESWQRLCRILGVGVPTTLKECRQRVQRTHVNLVDLTESPTTGNKVEIFPSVKALREYTLAENKIFPKEEAYEGGLLKTLLRQILTTSAKKPVKKRTDSGVDLESPLGINVSGSKVAVTEDGSIFLAAPHKF
ncbi:hypothetical protein QQX98_003693 [Neonectria punicea]|uniref:C3H1-type domain-containing protein n=1 Tax=Neonectria punicea TaxID=979145 RepID=A0ABR1HE33_9HYPO